MPSTHKTCWSPQQRQTLRGRNVNGNSSQRVGLRLEPKWLRTFEQCQCLTCVLSLPTNTDCNLSEPPRGLRPLPAIHHRLNGNTDSSHTAGMSASESWAVSSSPSTEDSDCLCLPCVRALHRLLCVAEFNFKLVCVLYWVDVHLCKAIHTVHFRLGH